MENSTSKWSCFPRGLQFSRPVASNWLRDDWGPGTLLDFLSEDVAETHARREGAAFVSGTGSSRPKGMIHTAPVATDDDASPERAAFTLQYVPIAAQTSPLSANITADGLVDVRHALKSGYWQRAAWLMNRATLGSIRKLRDEEDRLLFSPGLSAQMPMTLLGFPIVLVDAVPSIAIGSIPLLFGDLQRGYAILERPLALLVDPYTSKGQTKYFFSRRVTGHIVDSHAIKAGKVTHE